MTMREDNNDDDKIINATINNVCSNKIELILLNHSELMQIKGITMRYYIYNNNKIIY